MRRVFLLAAMCAVLGWIVGDLMRVSHAERAGAFGALGAKADHVASNLLGKLLTGGTRVRGEREGKLAQAAEDVPGSIRKAREQGAKARERAVQEMIINEKLGGFAKDHGWAQGGPYFPLGADLMKVQPRARPQLAAVPGGLRTYELGGPFAATPLSVPDPVGTFPFGPGNPATPPHLNIVESFGSSTPVVPEPATWLMLILGFWGLAWRTQRVRRAARHS
jgi:hypothetical protein